MTDLTPIECEARIVGLSKQRRKDGDWVEVKFHIHPDEHPAALFILPLGTQCMLGVRGVPENENETTEQPEQTQERPKGGERAKRAGILCNDTAFQSWIMRTAESHGSVFPHDIPPSAHAANIVRSWCVVDSRADLDHDFAAAQRFDSIVSDFYASQHGQLPEQMESMR